MACMSTVCVDHFRARVASMKRLTESLVNCCRGFSDHWQQKRWCCLHGCTMLPSTFSQLSGRYIALIQCRISLQQ